MQSYRPSLTQHRFQRLVLWALTLLSWIAAILSENRFVSPRHQRQRFDIPLAWLTRLVAMLVMARAARLARRRGKPLFWRHGRDLRRSHLLRSALGSRLRRALKHKEVRTRIANLIAVLTTIDAHAAPLAHRLRRGLTRVWRTWAPIALDMPLAGSPAPSPALADSS